MDDPLTMFTLALAQEISVAKDADLQTLVAAVLEAFDLSSAGLAENSLMLSDAYTKAEIEELADIGESRRVRVSLIGAVIVSAQLAKAASATAPSIREGEPVRAVLIEGKSWLECLKTLASCLGVDPALAKPASMVVKQRQSSSAVRAYKDLFMNAELEFILIEPATAAMSSTAVLASASVLSPVKPAPDSTGGAAKITTAVEAIGELFGLIASPPVSSYSLSP